MREVGEAGVSGSGGRLCLDFFLLGLDSVGMFFFLFCFVFFFFLGEGKVEKKKKKKKKKTRGQQEVNKSDRNSKKKKDNKKKSKDQNKKEKRPKYPPTPAKNQIDTNPTTPIQFFYTNIPTQVFFETPEQLKPRKGEE